MRVRPGVCVCVGAKLRGDRGGEARKPLTGEGEDTTSKGKGAGEGKKPIGEMTRRVGVWWENSGMRRLLV